MFKKLLTIALFLFTISTPKLFASQLTNNVMVVRGQGAVLPGSCSPDGVWFYKTTAPIGWQQCISAVYVGLGGGNILPLANIFTNANTIWPGTDVVPLTVQQALGTNTANHLQGKDNLGNILWFMDLNSIFNVPAVNLTKASPGKLDLQKGLTCAIVASTGAARVSNVVTITCTAPHGFKAGEIVDISGVSNGTFNANGFTIIGCPSTAAQCVPAATTFTYAQTAADATSGSGTVTNTCPTAGAAGHGLFCYDYATNRLVNSDNGGALKPVAKVDLDFTPGTNVETFWPMGRNTPDSRMDSSQVISGVPIVANQIYVMEISPEIDVPMSRLSMDLVAATTGTIVFDAGFFSSDAQTKIASLGGASYVTIGGAKTVTFTSVTLTHNVKYLYAWCVSNTDATGSYLSAGAIGNLQNLMNADATKIRFGKPTAGTCTAGVLPANFTLPLVNGANTATAAIMMTSAQQ